MGKKGAGISMGKKAPVVEESVVVPEQTLEIKEAAPRKRNPCPGVRLVGNRIYDPENGKTCHQVSTCRRPSPLFWICKCSLGHSVAADLVDSFLSCCPLAVSPENNGLCCGLQTAAKERALSNPLLPQVPSQQVNGFLPTSSFLSFSKGSLSISVV
jgi:hypothetical protein